MLSKIKKWYSLKLAEKPSTVVLLIILFLNLVLISITALIISSFNLKGTEGMGFFEACFYTISMIFDAGCVQYVVSDIGSTSTFIVILCLIVVVIGMVTFTGAVIGYVTNYISSFIEDANKGEHKLLIEDHIVILNWNTKASEIINDLLFKNEKITVVLLADEDKEMVKKDFEERVTRNQVATNLKNLKIIVREGEPYSAKQLTDINVASAKTIVILDSNGDDSDDKERFADSVVVKTLMMVAELCSKGDKNRKQTIIVESTNDWTHEIVKQIAEYKTIDNKCEIVDLPVHRILGHILAQLTIMPELNHAYNELLSFNGSEFYCEEVGEQNEEEIINNYLDTHIKSIPVSVMDTKYGRYFYTVAEDDKDCNETTTCPYVPKKLNINKDFTLKDKNVLILGHNQHVDEIINGFDSFYKEWGKNRKKILNVTILDDGDSLEKNKALLKRPYIKKVIKAAIYDKDIVSKAIDEAITKDKDTKIMILSDDRVEPKNIDVYSLTGLIYVQDVINNKKKKDKKFDSSYVDVIVEIIDPKHYHIVKGYSINNVVISNKFVSKMIMQLGERRELYEFYKDIITYDRVKGSKEIYIKKAKFFFNEMPEECTAFELIRDLYYSTKDYNPTILLGFFKATGYKDIIGGNQKDIKIKLEPEDKIVVYSSH